MAFLSIFKQGQRYLNTWPLESKLGIIFPENRVIRATQFAQKFMPFVAVFAVVWQQIYAKHDIAAFSLAILTALFALLLPFQGLYWLGKRAQMPLDAKSAVKFREIYTRFQAEFISFPTDKPTYQDLAEILRKAQQKSDRNFWQDI